MGRIDPKAKQTNEKQKKQEIDTLEKFKLDWESFKEEEKIGQELAIQNCGQGDTLKRVISGMCGSKAV